jgi:hypothetical protein
MARQHSRFRHERWALLRSIVAEAVHEAVCAFSQSDGYGRCQLYTVAGCILLTNVDGPGWYMQAGSAWILADPPDGFWHYDATQPLALARGEFHCWLAKEGATKGGPPAAFVDFSARHFHRTVNEMNAAGPREGGERIPWTHQTEPPPYIWTNGSPSDWVRWEPLPDLCEALYTQVVHHGAEYRRFHPLLAEAYRTRVRQHGLATR